MASGLEMGEVGEQYFAEGNYTLALEKFKSCLGILVRVLSKEPPGRRRELLHQQVSCLNFTKKHVLDIYYHLSRLFNTLSVYSLNYDDVTNKKCFCSEIIIQIQMWMKQAECTKGLLATKGVQDLTKSAETTDQCRLSQLINFLLINDTNCLQYCFY